MSSEYQEKPALVPGAQALPTVGADILSRLQRAGSSCHLTSSSELIGKVADTGGCETARANRAGEGRGGGISGRLLAMGALCLAFSAATRAQPEPAPTRAHPVVSLAESRLVRGSLPDQRTDGSNLCLAIEGGGMRGVVSAGMVTALEQLGLRDAFDAVYGTSAGAINGAYFVAGQAAYGTTIYYENVNNSRFIARRRIIIPGRVMSLEFLLDHVMVYEKILDWQAILESTLPLKVVVTSVERRRAEILEGFSSRQELWESLRASSRIPVIAGPPVTIGEDRYADGGLYAKIPLDLAVADLCTHVLVLQTWPSGHERPEPGPLRRCLVRRYLRKFDPELAEKYGRGPSAHDHAMEAIRLGSVSGDGPPYVLGVTLEPEQLVPTFEKRQHRLMGGARDGFRALMKVFGHLGTDSEPPPLHSGL